MDEGNTVLKFLEQYIDEINRDNAIMADITGDDLREIKRIVLEENTFSKAIQRIVSEFKIVSAKELITFIYMAFEIRRRVDEIIKKLSV